MKRAIFLDKDGTLIRDVPYNVDPAHIELVPYAPAALQVLQEAGFGLWMITNQPGIARGYFTSRQLEAACHYIAGCLQAHGVVLQGFYYCPHDPAGDANGRRCKCHKPLPGMLYRAAYEHGIDLAASWMIGDILHDVEAGNRAGCHTILIANGHETEWQMNRYRQPSLIADNLLTAARCILQRNKLSKRVEQL